MQGLRRLAQTLSESQRSASTLGRAAEAVKSQVSSAASTVSDTAKAVTKTIGIKGKQGKGYIQFLEDATRRDTAVGAMKQYARALIDGNLAEVAIYAGNGPGAVFKGTDSHGNRYYERLDAYNCRSRMIMYSNIAEGNIQGYEASSIPADGWYSWLHYTTDQLPSERNIMVPVYAKAREVTWMGQPKLAEGRFFPKGHWYQGNKRRNWVKLAPWQPPGPRGEEVRAAETRATTQDFAGGCIDVPPPTCMVGAARGALIDHAVGAGAVLLGFFALLACIALGWLLTWKTTLRKYKFLQDIFQRKPPNPDARKNVNAEIERIRRQHSRQAAPKRSAAAARRHA